MMYKNFTHTLKLIKPGKLSYLSLLLIVVCNFSNYAQQAPHYTQYLYNMQVLNPAFVGANADVSISLLSRQQWVGVEGAPQTNTFSISGRIPSGLGFGLTVINDKIGLSESNNINIDASYTIPTSEYGRLTFGLKGGIHFFNNNLSNAITVDNEVYASTNGTFPNIGFGALYYYNNFFVGLSIPNILKSSQFRTLETFTNIGGGDSSNYFLATGIVYNLSENFKFKPSTIIKYTPTLPVAIDLNANFIYKKKIETGLSYRYKTSISALFAVIINEKYRIGYTYDTRITNYGSNLSSHEIILRFDFDLNRGTRWLFQNRCYF